MLEVGRLRALLAMSEHGGSPGAASAFGRPAGDIAGQLSDWERELGLALVDGDRLTPAGRRLAEHAGTLLGQLEAAESDAAAVAGRPAGTLRLGVGADAGRVLLADTLAALAPTELRLHVRQLADERVGALDSTLDAVVVGEYAAAVPHRPDPAVERRELLTEPLLLAVPSGHRATGASVRLAELSGETWVGGRGDALVALERAAAGAGFAPRLVAEVGEDALALTLVAGGLGVALVPASAAPSLVQGVRLLTVLDGGLRRTVLAAVRRSRSADPGVRLLLDALGSAARRVAAAVPGVTAAIAPAGPVPAPGRRPDPLLDPLPPEPRSNGRRDPWADRPPPDLDLPRNGTGAGGTGAELPPRNGTPAYGPSSLGPSSLGPSAPGPSSLGPSSLGPSALGPSSPGPSSGPNLPGGNGPSDRAGAPTSGRTGPPGPVSPTDLPGRGPSDGRWLDDDPEDLAGMSGLSGFSGRPAPAGDGPRPGATGALPPPGALPSRGGPAASGSAGDPLATSAPGSPGPGSSGPGSSGPGSSGPGSSGPGSSGPGSPGPGSSRPGGLPAPGAEPPHRRGASPYRTPPPTGDAPDFTPELTGLAGSAGPNPYRADTSAFPAPDPFRTPGSEPEPYGGNGRPARRESLGGTELFTTGQRPGAGLPPPGGEAGLGGPRPRATGGDGADGTLPPAPAGAADDVRLSIFEDLQSEWFVQPQGGAKAEAWHMAADDGWAAAARLAEPTTAGTTTAGLPRRRPQAMVVPGAVGGSTEPGRAGPPQPSTPHRSPQEVRGRLSSYRDGVRRGRHAQRPTDEQ